MKREENCQTTHNVSGLSRRAFLRQSGLGAVSAMTAMALSRNAAAAKRLPRRPNIVFILIDDMGWADAGCYGHAFHETPSIDRLASQGMRFTDAYAACPVCSPTRASIMSGLSLIHI